MVGNKKTGQRERERDGLGLVTKRKQKVWFAIIDQKKGLVCYERLIQGLQFLWPACVWLFAMYEVIFLKLNRTRGMACTILTSSQLSQLGHHEWATWFRRLVSRIK